ncbi:conserved hypothetical protein [Gammaproteobacteria bacterium]
MGGFGSGFHGRAKATTASRFRLEATKWARLTPGTTVTALFQRRGEPCGSLEVRPKGDALGLSYAHEASGRAWQQDITIERTLCHFGGSRPWLVCPNCGRRCGVLFMETTGFACVICSKLNYPSTREEPLERRFHKAHALRARLGWPPGLDMGQGTRPRYMHKTTFARLVAAYERSMGLALGSLKAKLGGLAEGAWP